MSVRVMMEPSFSFIFVALWICAFGFPYPGPPMEILLTFCLKGLWIFLLAQLDPLYAVWWVVSLAVSALFGILLFHSQHTFNPGYVVEKAHEWKQSEAAFKGSSLLWIPPLLLARTRLQIASMPRICCKRAYEWRDAPGTT